MSNEMDDLEALFEAESARFGQTAAVEPASAPAVALPPAGEGGLDRYYQAVSGLYLRGADGASAPAAAAAGVAHAPETVDASMYERLGSIVRQLHDSLRSLGYDKSLAEANSQISDAQDRLAHIAALTEQSAVKVLNTLEAAMPAQEAMIRQGREMEERWARLFAGKIGIDEFKVLAADARAFSASVAAEGEREKARLLEIMMAQDFQDLTGQIIKKVVGVTQGIEQDLARLLLDNAPAPVKEKHVELMAGPSTPGVALVQGDVDDLLADLGF
ncbi:protein phosphatase CheZ [Janthinobacterium sp. 17J80-10]|uniref:protein phosphatase CheZ n=1 Tax=Janthinobacterium sp. 17J80-10 TaxID=2497863 RepID=UPI00100589B6|nr:protein phosphatase CheZ [Janthinobacterium sp. 17J80-10]QAU33464.1 protein phosphatase CheZ [Janthinobacterium sp. 17J80-10]